MRHTPTSPRSGWRTPDQGGLLQAVTDALPNVTGIRVQDILAAVAALLDQVAAALTATGSLTLFSGRWSWWAPSPPASAAARMRRSSSRPSAPPAVSSAPPGCRVRRARPCRRSDRRAGRDPGQLRRRPLHHAHRLGVSAGGAGGDPDCVPRHDADLSAMLAPLRHCGPRRRRCCGTNDGRWKPEGYRLSLPDWLEPSRLIAAGSDVTGNPPER